MGTTREELEVKLEELYKELGKAYYEIGINDPLPELSEQLDAVKDCREEITALIEAEAEKKALLERQKKIADSICLECDLPVPAGSNFCNHCGKPMPNAEMVAEAVKALAEAEEEEAAAQTIEEIAEEVPEVIEEPVVAEEPEQAEEVIEEPSEASEPADEEVSEDSDVTEQLTPEVQEAFMEPEGEMAAPFIPETAAVEPAQRFCKQCGHILLPKHKFCPGCGKPVALC